MSVEIDNLITFIDDVRCEPDEHSHDFNDCAAHIIRSGDLGEVLKVLEAIELRLNALEA